ncbi:MAG: C40 family peptidase, partial [Lachnospiraceae bacterium]|nr:C40 family peptidase [Lachnospiraceae bacterium]
MKQVVKELFNEQYDLSYKERTETRSRTVTKTGYYEVESENGGITKVPYTYTEIEYYTVKILTVTLKNNSLGTVIASKGMNEDEQARYALLLETQGNKAYLFDDAYVDYEDPEEYQIPPDALSDQTFAAMIAEGEKYLGRTYVWGGSSPSTGFDCSGFVSWVINHSGWNLGRQTADQLKHTCT